jgi:hypothetical protein
LPAPSTTSNEAHDQQEQYGTDSGVDDCTDQSGPEMDAELGQQPASDKGTQDSDDKVADESEAGPLHDLAGEPAGNEADKQYDQQAFARHVHLVTSRFAREEHHKPAGCCLYQIDQLAAHGALNFRD